VLVIGDEILSGRTQDKNVSTDRHLAQRAGHPPEGSARRGRCGGGTSSPRCTPCKARYDYVFTTGGIGPTHDDITVDAIAKAQGVAVVVHPDARAVLERYYETPRRPQRRAACEWRACRKARTSSPNRYSGRAGNPARQSFHHGGGAAHHGRDARCAYRHAGGAATPGTLGPDRMLGGGKARSPSCCSQPNGAHEG
jgi:hypothetical protein